MNYQLLKDEILNGPLSENLKDKGDKEIADILNAQTFTDIKERYVTARTVLAELGATTGATILDKLEAAAAQSSPVKWMLKFLTQDSGLDVGQTETQGCIDGLVTAGVLTQEEGSALKNMALQPASMAEIIGLGSVTYGDVSIALRGDI